VTSSDEEPTEFDDVEWWQIEEIKKGLEEADRGEFASDEEVEETLKRLTRGYHTGNS
jgi:predicted transcriptional regulator